jgi:tetratricopeptide (TPR) repeat protein
MSSRPRIDPARALALAVALVAFLVPISRIRDYDIWYHLRAGYLILSSGIPRTDPFSFTAGAEPASVQSWLAGVLYALAHRALGIPGVQLLNAALVAGAIALVLAAIRLHDRAGRAWLAALLCVLAVFAARFRLGARPHVFEFALLAAMLLVLHRLRLRGRGPLWLLPVLQVVWVNVHGSHVLGVVLPLLFLAGEAAAWALPGLLRPDETAALPRSRYAGLLAGAALANALATLVNPHGWRALAFPFEVARMGAYMAQIGEWQPISLDLLAGYGVRYTWAFSALAILGLAGFALRGRRAAPVHAVLFATFLVLALRGVRLIPEFAIATLPGTFACLAPAADRLTRGRERAFAWGALAAVLLAFPAALLDRSYQWGLGVKERVFPAAALDFARRAGVQGNVFNSFAFGDWLVFHAPERKVFIHGRNEVFPEAFYEDFRAAHRDGALFRRLADRWDLQWTLLEYELTDLDAREAMPHLASDPDWVPVYWDRVAVIYVRRSGPNAALAERLGTRVLRPTRFDFDYLERAAAAGRGGEALADVNALLARAPDNEEAHLAAAYVLHALRNRAGALRALQNALAINPSRAATHSAIGALALERGDRTAARAAFDEALGLQPSDPGAVWGMGQLGIKVTPPAGMPAGHP